MTEQLLVRCFRTGDVEIFAMPVGVVSTSPVSTTIYRWYFKNHLV